jgi:C4-dicarboxylate-specific signal transduction histidine kinase
LAHHVRFIIEGQAEINKLVQAILDSPTEARLKIFRLHYAKAYDDAEATAAGYRRLLFWCSLFLLTIVIVSMARLVRAANSMAEANEMLEHRVRERTKELSLSHDLILQQQQSLVSTTKMSALGEMAGGVAHEINNPLAIIQTISGQMAEVLAEEPIDAPSAIRMATTITKTTERIAKIVQGLRTFSRDGSNDPFETVTVPALIEDTIVLCQERFRTNGIKLILEGNNQNISFEGRSVQISQVILNLLNNALDAIHQEKDKWVRLTAADLGEHVEIRVEDCGPGLPPHVRKKLFQPFFTTKEIGKGTGMGLSISLGLILAHGGSLDLAEGPHTCFVIRLPKRHKTPAQAA